MARPALSRGEMHVIQAVWKTGEATVGQIHAAVESSGHAMDYTTVQTYIRRLEAKGYLLSERVGRTKVYRASVPQRQVRREAIRDLLRHLFDGQPLPLVRHLLAEGELDEKDIAELKQILDEPES